MPMLRDFDPTIPAWLNQLVARLLDRQPGRRADSTASVAKTLHVCLAHVQNPAENKLPDSLRFSRALTGRKLAFVLGAVGVGLALGFVVFKTAAGPTSHLKPFDVMEADVNSSGASPNSSLDWDDGQRAKLREIRVRLENLGKAIQQRYAK